MGGVDGHGRAQRGVVGVGDRDAREDCVSRRVGQHPCAHRTTCDRAIDVGDGPRLDRLLARGAVRHRDPVGLGSWARRGRACGRGELDVAQLGLDLGGGAGEGKGAGAGAVCAAQWCSRGQTERTKPGVRLDDRGRHGVRRARLVVHDRCGRDRNSTAAASHGTDPVGVLKIQRRSARTDADGARAAWRVARHEGGAGDNRDDVADVAAGRVWIDLAGHRHGGSCTVGQVEVAYVGRAGPGVRAQAVDDRVGFVDQVGGRIVCQRQLRRTVRAVVDDVVAVADAITGIDRAGIGGAGGLVDHRRGADLRIDHQLHIHGVDLVQVGGATCTGREAIVDG